MKKWPLNSITLFTATYNKLRKAADGTGTQVATCMINKWMAKINEKEIYNGKCLPRVGEEKKKRKKKEDGCSSYHPWKLSPLSTKEPKRRRISPRTKPKDKLLPFLHAFDHSISLWSCPAVEALTKAQFLSPFFLPNLLYLARWVWAHLPNSKEPPNSGPYSTYLDNKKNLWTNHKSGISKNNNNKSITNPSKKKTQKPNNLLPNFSLSFESSIPFSNDSTLCHTIHTSIRSWKY